MDKSATIHQLIVNSKKQDLHAASEETGKGTHHNEARKVQNKNTGQVEPNNPKAENPEGDQVDEKELPPFQAGKPVI